MTWGFIESIHSPRGGPGFPFDQGALRPPSPCESAEDELDKVPLRRAPDEPGCAEDAGGVFGRFRAFHEGDPVRMSHGMRQWTRRLTGFWLFWVSAASVPAEPLPLRHYS